MNMNNDIRDFVINSNLDVFQTIDDLILPKLKEEAKRTFSTYRYEGFYLVNEYVESGTDKKLISSNVISSEKEMVMTSGNEIEIITLSNSNYLISSTEQTMLIEIVSGEVEVLTCISRLEPGAMYKLTEYLNKNGLIILTDYSKEEKRAFEYLYDFKTGKKISSGFDTIDEENGILKVTYGIATGSLDLEGNFVLEPEKSTIRQRGFFTKLFNKEKC